MKVWIVEPDGTDRWEEVPDNQSQQIHSLQGFVGGWLEQVNRQDMFDNKVCMLVDEEGLLKNKDYNAEAARISTYPGMIAGTAIFVGLHRDPIAGDTWSNCPQEWVTSRQ